MVEVYFFTILDYSIKVFYIFAILVNRSRTIFLWIYSSLNYMLLVIQRITLPFLPRVVCCGVMVYIG